jgi:PAS domain S-box-containing protein
MQLSAAHIENAYNTALAGAVSPGANLFAALDTIPAPIYVTDADGFVIHFNPACIDFAGRTPVVGHDRWCVTWKLFTDTGLALPHELCPMADAIKQKRSISGVTAIAARPDGTWVRFRPYPVPLMDANGELVGAVNMLLDVTDRRQAESLRSQAERCRRLARDVSNPRIAEDILALADEYDDKADLLDAAV